MAKAKKPVRSRGRQPRLPKLQLDFLCSFQPQWEEARARKEKLVMSQFYDTVTTRFMDTFPNTDLSSTSATVNAFESTIVLNSTGASGSGSGSGTDPITSIGANRLPSVSTPNPPSAEPVTHAVSQPNLPTTPPVPDAPTSHTDDQSSIDPVLRQDSSPNDLSISANVPRTTQPVISNTATLNDKATQRAQTRQFIVAWFHHHSRKLTKSDAQGLISSIRDVATQKPVKDRVLISYQRKHYDERIRERYERYLVEETGDWERAVAEGNPAGLKEPIPMGIRNRAARDAWADEEEAFKAAFLAELDAEYKDALDSFMNRTQSPSTPEEYHKAYQAMPAVINQFIEGLSHYLGVAVTIMMVGPVPSQGGQVAINSMHSQGIINGVAKSWPQYDPTTFKQVEESLVAYGRRVYSIAEQKARALPGTESLFTNPTSLSSTVLATKAKPIPPPPATLASPPVPVPSDDNTISSPQGPSRSVNPSPPATPPQVSSLLRPSLPPAPLSVVPASQTSAPSQSLDPTPSSDRLQLPRTDSVQPPGSLPHLSPRSSQQAVPPSSTRNPPSSSVVPPVGETHPQTLATNASSPGNAPTTQPSATDQLGSDGDLLDLSVGLHRLPGGLQKDYNPVVSQTGWGGTWKLLVTWFVRFELDEHEAGLLPTNKRPKDIATWMKCGRKSSVHPVNPDTFSDTLKAWWCGMQPDERGEQGQDRPTATIPTTSWTLITKSGRNGFFLVVLSLFWWRHAIDKKLDGDSRTVAYQHWEKIVDDVLWVLRSIISCGRPPNAPKCTGSGTPLSRKQQGKQPMAVSGSLTPSRTTRAAVHKRAANSDIAGNRESKRRRR